MLNSIYTVKITFLVTFTLIADAPFFLVFLVLIYVTIDW